VIAPLLEVRGLSVRFPAPGGGEARAVDGVSLSVARGEILCLVGESGCGKSMTALSILRLVPPPGRIAAGELLFEGRDLLALGDEEMRRVRGDRIAMVFQEPMSALNPVFTVGEQVAEAFRVHRGERRREAWAHAVEMLARTGIPDPERRAREFPHQLSGGTQQRVLIAMAMACDPDLLLADEPTTALDVTVQAQILALFEGLVRGGARGAVLITHDLGVVAQAADRVAVMYAGAIVEESPVGPLFAAPQHPYTIGLLDSLPSPGRRGFSAIPGSVPGLADLPPGCRFAPRCPRAQARCREAEPPLAGEGGRRVRCLFPGRRP
jgi:oligopeptide/dipeptide ABC transporter ATP-binding protein